MSRALVRDRRFWAVQAVVVALVSGHFAVDVVSDRAATVPAGIPVALLLVPVSYAALRFGLAGSVTTAAAATGLWLPDLLLPGDRGHAGNDVIELVLVLAVALFVGHHIDAEQKERNRARHLASQLLKAEEREQQRIAQELHDEPLQLLVTLSRSLDYAAAEAALCPGLSARLVEAREDVLDIATRLRAVVRGLRPPALDRLGLAPALRGLVAEVDNPIGARIDLVIGGGDDRLPPEVELGVYRIAQEALNNAVRHGRPRNIWVTYHQTGHGVHLRVADDGDGFEKESLPATEDRGGFGLVGMRERADLMGGRLELRSDPGEGTIVDLSLTLEAPLEHSTAHMTASSVAASTAHSNASASAAS